MRGAGSAVTLGPLLFSVLLKCFFAVKIKDFFPVIFTIIIRQPDIKGLLANLYFARKQVSRLTTLLWMHTSSSGTSAKSPNSAGQGLCTSQKPTQDMPLPASRHGPGWMGAVCLGGLLDCNRRAWKQKEFSVGTKQLRRWKCSIHTRPRSILPGALLLTQHSQFSQHQDFMRCSYGKLIFLIWEFSLLVKGTSSPTNWQLDIQNADRNKRFWELNAK